MVSISASEDSHFFVTASSDVLVNYWNAHEIEKDLSAHSLFSIPTYRHIRCTTMLDNAYSFAIGGENGVLEVYSPLEIEPTMREEMLMFKSNVTRQKNYENCYRIKRIQHEGEGDVMGCLNLILPQQREHVLVYAT